MDCRSSSTLAIPPGTTEYKYDGRLGRIATNDEYVCFAPFFETSSLSFFSTNTLDCGVEYAKVEAGCWRANCQVITAVAANRRATRNQVWPLTRLRRWRR